MRKILLIVLTCLTCSMVCGCENSEKKEAAGNEKATEETAEQSEDLTAKDDEEVTEEKVLVKQDLPNYLWAHYDTALGEELILSFSENGDYSYHCACGEHIDDSDLHNAFSYNDRIKIFRIYNRDDSSIANKELLALYMDEHTLLINTGEDIIEYYNAEVGNSGLDEMKDYICDETCGALLTDYDGYSTILEMKENELVLGPVYDTGAEDWIVQRTVAFSENIEFYELQIENIEQHSCQCQTVTKTDIEEKVQEATTRAFIWYDWNGNVTKIVIF